MKKIIAVVSLVFAIFTLTACRESDRVSTNLSREADEFKVIRKVTVINTDSDKVVLQAQGLISIEDKGSQLIILIKDEGGVYKKEIIGLNNHVTYTLEQVEPSDVSSTKYKLVFNPDMIQPFEVELK